MKRNYTITQIIISINVAIFLTAMITNQTNLYILRLGLNSPYNISFLSYITAAFMHASIFHIGFNMIFLYMVGPVFENFLGKQRYLLSIYLQPLYLGF